MPGYLEPISPEYRRKLVVMVKEPRPGRVKTRLGRDIGMVAAAAWYRNQVKRLLRSLSDPRWDLLLSVAPYTAMTSRAWPASLPRLPQGHGDLGARMARIMRSLPPGPVAIVGSDIPGITRPHIAEAFRGLGQADAVFGPAPDGGYWLVGMRRTGHIPVTLFEDVRWSGPHALADSMRSMGDLRIATVAKLRDVDTVEDLTI